MKLGIALLAILALAASGQETSLPKATEAWKWTTEQRIAARLDPGGMAERRHAHIQQKSDNPAVVVIDAETHSELFLPHELMTFVITDSDPRHPTGRWSYEPVLARFGWAPDVFWNDVRSIGGAYIQLQQEHERPTDDESRRLCALRATALAEMRQKYPRFDEFLYAAAVARGGTLYSQDVPSASWLMWLEGGCK